MKWVRHPKQCPCILEFICYGNGNDICDCDYQLTMHWITTQKKKKKKLQSTNERIVLLVITQIQ